MKPGIQLKPTSEEVKFINLGKQVFRVVPNQAVIVSDNLDNGKTNLLCICLKGNPAQFVVVDVETAAIFKVLDIPNTTGVMSMTVGQDGKVYICTTSPLDLYSYTPGAPKLEYLGRPVEGETHSWCLITGANGKIYCGTYPRGLVFEFDPVSKAFRNLGTIIEGEKYARQLAYDYASDALYIGTGTGCKLIRYDMKTGHKTGNLLPAELSIEEYPNSIDIVGDKLYIQLNKTSKMIVMDKETGQIECSIEKASMGVVASLKEDQVLIVADHYLCCYEPHGRQVKKISQLGDGAGWKAAKILQFDVGSSPGYTLVALLGHNVLMKYNLQTNILDKRELNLPPQPIEIRSIQKGPDGNIYISGILGGLTIFNPLTGESKSSLQISQAEGITAMGHIMYFGLYPQARIAALDTLKPLGKGNPREIFRIPSEDLQDRPFAMLGVEKENKVFIGTVAQYGQIKGAFTVYDISTGELQRYRDIVHNQSVVTLAYKDGNVYGGTSIWGSLGTNPTENEGKLFIWNTAENRKVHETVPVPGNRAVTGLTVGPDGNIWGMAEGSLFIFDPKTNSVLYASQIVPVQYKGWVWTDAHLETGKDGNIYGSSSGYFFKIDSETTEVTILDTSKHFELMSQDDHGNLYMRANYEGCKEEMWSCQYPSGN